MGFYGQRHAPAALPPGKNLYPLYRRVGGHQGQSGRVRKISPPPVFDPRTVQPLAIRYTDWAIPAHVLYIAILRLDYFRILLCYLNKVFNLSISIHFSNFGHTLLLKPPWIISPVLRLTATPSCILFKPSRRQNLLQQWQLSLIVDFLFCVRNN